MSDAGRPEAPAMGSSEPRFGTGDVAAALDRMLVSPSFARSPRLQAFLRYIVEARLAGREDSPKEYELGTSIFERKQSFDPQTDPIVRVQARQLRFKLREYYESSGANEAIRIALPKGTYLPTITYDEGPPKAPTEQTATVRSADSQSAEARSANLPSSELLPGETLLPDIAAPVEQPSSRGWGRRWMLWLLIAGALPLLLLGLRKEIEPPPIVPYRPVAKAHDLNLEGRYYWNQRKPESLAKAASYFTQATVEDPNYAQAYVGLADTYNLMPEYAGMPAAEAYSRAIKAAQRAIELDDGSAEAHSSFAFDLFWGAWDAPGSEREFRRAIQLDPDYVRAHHWYATSLLAQGRLSDALLEMDKARELDPTSPSLRADYSLVLFDLGRRDEAMANLRELSANDPSFLSPHRYLAMLAECTNDASTFVTETEEGAALSKNPADAAIAKAARAGFRSGGEKGMLQGVLDVQMSMYGKGEVTAYNLAQTAALLGRPKDAMYYLQAAYDRRESDMMAIPTQCSFRSLRSDPAFRNLLIRMHEVQRGGSAASLR